MSASNSWTVFCDGDGCERYSDNGDTTAAAARRYAHKEAGWTRSGKLDLCPACAFKHAVKREQRKQGSLRTTVVELPEDVAKELRDAVMEVNGMFGPVGAKQAQILMERVIERAWKEGRLGMLKACPTVRARAHGTLLHVEFFVPGARVDVSNITGRTERDTRRVAWRSTAKHARRGKDA